MKDIKAISIKAGLGNQLFQYAHGRNLIEQGQEIIFDISFFSSNTQDTTRPFLLKKFNIPESIIFINQRQNLLKKIFNKIYSKITGNYNFFQSELYFKNIEHIIRKEFTLKDPLSNDAQKFKDIILQTPNSVSIHIRRGDYISNTKAHKYHGVCDINYYQKAITHITQKLQFPTFFVFSDDIEWVKENLNTDNVIYVSNRNLTECEELMLMSYCKHNIIANSTFSWWGAWLNSNHDKIIIAPKQWMTKKSSNQLNILPKTWIQI